MRAGNKPNELQITRVYDAPVEAVWEAWTDPEQVAQWWGPRGFSITTHRKDLRPGGFWDYTMHGPDGVDYHNKTIYHEVEEYKRLVYDHGGNDDRPPLFRVTVTFAESDDKTTMNMTMALPNRDEAVNMRKFIKQAGGNATWDRLAEYLDKHARGRDSFVINRSFNAPKELVFEMWSEPDHFSKWLPPTGFDMEFLDANILVGGISSFRMTNNADVTMYGRIEYKEIDKPCRLVYAQQFCDEQGNLSRHPKLTVWPATILITVLLSAIDADFTRVSVTSEPFGETTPEEVQAFVDLRPSMTLGWTGSFDKLESLLAKEEPSSS